MCLRLTFLPFYLVVFISLTSFAYKSVAASSAVANSSFSTPEFTSTSFSASSSFSMPLWFEGFKKNSHTTTDVSIFTRHAKRR